MPKLQPMDQIGLFTLWPPAARTVANALRPRKHFTQKSKSSLVLTLIRPVATVSREFYGGWGQAGRGVRRADRVRMRRIEVRSLRFAIPAILIATVSGAAAQGQATGPSRGVLERTPGALNGKVAGADGAGLAGVVVKLFEEGFLLAETATAEDGSYHLEVDYLADSDWTLVVWFVPPESALVPEIVILRESLRSQELGLWSGCLPRIDLQPVMRFDARLVNEEQKLEQMSQMDCVKG